MIWTMVIVNQLIIMAHYQVILERDRGVVELNVVFWFFVVAVIVFLWFVLSFLFKPIGKYVTRLVEDVKEEIED